MALAEERIQMTSSAEQKLTELLDRLAALERQNEHLQKCRQRDRVWDFLLKLTVPAVLAACGIIVKHEVELSRILESRFSVQDAHALEMRVMANGVPAWLREQLAEIKVLLRQQDERMRVLEARIK